MLNIQNFFWAKGPLADDFDYKNLYNDGRGAVFKEEYKRLIRQAIKSKVITIEKYIVAEDVQEDLYEIGEERKKPKSWLLNALKDYYQESDDVITPIIFLLRKIDPGHSVLFDESERKLKIESHLGIEIRPRIDDANAVPRIYFTKDKISISTTNDNAENLGRILAVRDVEVYILGTEGFLTQNIVTYHIKREDERFFEVARGYEDTIMNQLYNDIFN